MQSTKIFGFLKSGQNIDDLTLATIIATAASLVIKPTTDGSTAIQICDKDGNPIVNIDTKSNRVGIGQTAPDSIFHIKSSGELLRLESTTASGSGAAYITIEDPSGVKAYIGYTDADDDINILNRKAAGISFGTNNAMKMHLLSSGALIIANTVPVGSEILRVDGDAYFDHGVSALTFTDRP